MNNNVTGIILLAGNSTRYGKGINKNFELIEGKNLFLYSLNIFNENDNINDIILVVRELDLKFVRDIIASFNLKKDIKVVIGGDSRSKSVYNAITSTNSKYVVIHDAARPLIKSTYIDEALSYINEYHGVITGVPVKDTIKIVNDKGEIVESTNRVYTFIGQTPQIFERNILVTLHEKYKNDLNITDDAMLLEMDGYKVKLIKGDYSNIKVTTSDDIIYVKEYIKSKKMRR